MIENRITKRLQKQSEYDTDKAITIHNEVYDELKKAQASAKELASMDPKNINGWKEMYDQICELVEKFEK